MTSYFWSEKDKDPRQGRSSYLMENGDYASHHVYTKLNRSSHGRCSHDTETSIRSSASTAWSWQYLHQRRGLAPLVQLGHQLVGYFDVPMSLTALAGSTWPLRPHVDTGAGSAQCSSRPVHTAGGGGGPAWPAWHEPACTTESLQLTSLKGQQRFCFGGWHFIITAVFLLYQITSLKSLKIASSLKVLVAQRGRLRKTRNLGAEPEGRAGSYTQSPNGENPMTPLFSPRDGNRTVPRNRPLPNWKWELPCSSVSVFIHSLIHAFNIFLYFLYGTYSPCPPDHSPDPFTLCLGDWLPQTTSPSSLALLLPDGLG